MKADSLHLGKVFSSGGDVHYVLPHFQREYTWDRNNWHTLIKDLFGVYDIYSDSNTPEHFMGALVVINDGTRNGTVPVFRLVDGQQRLTTISVLLCALSRLVAESHPGMAKKIRRLLVNEDEDGTLYFKLLPTLKYGDQESYTALIRGNSIPARVDSRIPPAYDYLEKELRTRLEQGKLDPEKLFIVVVNCLQVVFVDLNQDERPYEIFESLNYKGKTLTQADLVRNYIAMKLPESTQNKVFDSYWAKIEETLQEKRTVGRSRLGELTAFLRHYFAFLSGTLINEEHVYSRFRDRGEQMSVDDFIDEMKRLERFSQYYNRLLRPDSEGNRAVRHQLERLNVLESTTAYPFLLFMYDNVEQGVLNIDEFLAGLRSLETYLVRRFLAKESTNYLNKLFPVLSRDIDIKNFNVSLKKSLVSRSFPSDSRLRQSAENVELYNKSRHTRQKLALIFSTINRHLSAGDGAFTQLDDEPTIEHIMPQTLTEAWRQHIGKDWVQDYELLHTLGNLTLVTQEWNSSLSNSIFSTKREKLASHGLLLNSDYFSTEYDTWDGRTIRERAQWLVGKANEIWPMLGELQESPGRKEKPKALTILGESYAVKSWRDVLHSTAECVVQWRANDFEKVAKEIAQYIKQEKFEGKCRQLSNGWWLYVNLSSESVKRICQNMLDIANIPEEEFDLEVW